jgi:hydroxymethylbilane synthase
MTSQEIAIGSRGSPLAMVQAKLVAKALQRVGRRSRIVVIETQGDRRAPDTAWGEGAFVAAIERTLAAGRVDVAVHSAKDVPTDEDPRLRIGAYLRRADPRDALVVRAGAAEQRLEDLPRGSRVGTDSPRRTGFLLARRPDLDVHPLHGNVDTRLRRLEDGETDALVLACAGLDRMGLGERIAERLDPETLPPAPGQGAIAVQIRRDDARMLALAASIDYQRTRIAVEAERAFLRASGGGCRAPIGALATVINGEIDLLGGFASPDGSGTARAHRRGPVGTGHALAGQLAIELDSHARVRATERLMDPDSSATPTRRVLVTRAPGQADELMAALRDAGLDPVSVPTITVEYAPPGGDLDAAARRVADYGWIVVTSPNGARAMLGAAERVQARTTGPRWAAIGRATRDVLEHAGIEVAFQPGRGRSTSIGLEMPIVRGDRVLLARGNLADGDLTLALLARGAEVDEVIAYRTSEAPEESRALLRSAMAAGPIDAVLFTSGSTVRGLVALARSVSLDVTSIPSVCIGPETAAAALAAGFAVIEVSDSPDANALAFAAAGVLTGASREIH